MFHLQMKKLYNIIVLSLISAFILLISNTLNVSAEQATGVLVPLYVDSSSELWGEIIDIKNSHPSVPMIVIINPSNGPGHSMDQDYVTAIKKLQTAGIIVLGYASTDYGYRDSNRVMDYVDRYKDWYNVNGILFDEMSVSPDKKSYYKELNDYAKSKGLSFTVGNAGTLLGETYVDVVDNVIIFEEEGLPSISDLSQWHSVHLKNFSVIGYSVSDLDQSYITNASKYLSYIYVTNDDLPNPWNSLPPYFEDLVTALDRNNPSN